MTTHILNWLGSEDAFESAKAEGAAGERSGGGSGDGVGPVCIGTVEGPLRAEIARTYLEQAGLSVYLQAESVGSIYGLVTGPLGFVRVLVPAAQSEEAARIFAELDFADQETGEQP
jgi:Putative prokaryotic signal transducing protein